MSMAVISSALPQPATMQEPAVPPLAHALARAGEVQQREHGEGKLQRQHHLAEGQQVGDAAVAAHADDEDRRQRSASVRVISRRTQGRMRQCMNPSITTWPASVPVMVLLCPLASSATANSVLAAAVPSSGASVR